MPGDDLLTVREVAARLHVCTATIYKLVAEKKLPAIRVAGSFIRIRAADLVRLCEPYK